MDWDLCLSAVVSLERGKWAIRAKEPGWLASLMMLWWWGMLCVSVLCNVCQQQNHEKKHKVKRHWWLNYDCEIWTMAMCVCLCVGCGGVGCGVVCGGLHSPGLPSGPRLRKKRRTAEGSSSPSGGLPDLRVVKAESKQHSSCTLPSNNKPPTTPPSHLHSPPSLFKAWTHALEGHWRGPSLVPHLAFCAKCYLACLSMSLPNEFIFRWMPYRWKKLTRHHSVEIDQLSLLMNEDAMLPQHLDSIV